MPSATPWPVVATVGWMLSAAQCWRSAGSASMPSSTSAEDAPATSCLLASTSTGSRWSAPHACWMTCSSSCRASSQRSRSLLSTTKMIPCASLKYLGQICVCVCSQFVILFRPHECVQWWRKRQTIRREACPPKSHSTSLNADVSNLPTVQECF